MPRVNLVSIVAIVAKMPSSQWVAAIFVVVYNTNVWFNFMNFAWLFVGQLPASAMLLLQLQDMQQLIVMTDKTVSLRLIPEQPCHTT